MTGRRSYSSRQALGAAIGINYQRINQNLCLELSHSLLRARTVPLPPSVQDCSEINGRSDRQFRFSSEVRMSSRRDSRGFNADVPAPDQRESPGSCDSPRLGRLCSAFALCKVQQESLCSRIRGYDGGTIQDFGPSFSPSNTARFSMLPCSLVVLTYECYCSSVVCLDKTANFASLKRLHANFEHLSVLKRCSSFEILLPSLARHPISLAPALVNLIIPVSIESLTTKRRMVQSPLNFLEY
jgi:hypothetical protein